MSTVEDTAASAAPPHQIITFDVILRQFQLHSVFTAHFTEIQHNAVLLRAVGFWTPVFWRIDRASVRRIGASVLSVTTELRVDWFCFVPGSLEPGIPTGALSTLTFKA